MSVHQEWDFTVTLVQGRYLGSGATSAVLKSKSQTLFVLLLALHAVTFTPMMDKKLVLMVDVVSPFAYLAFHVLRVSYMLSLEMRPSVTY